ncbi:hypothetical protein [Neorhizobium sp. DAR64861/K0K2]|uniref:hypothetical protein n=1 Tax=unclassified Neorhizobium TaxID=2629175 RepID=UPI003D2B696C
MPSAIESNDASELKVDLVDPCANLRMGTAMFAKILRFVAKRYGNPRSEEVFPLLFDDAIRAWRPGKFKDEACYRLRIRVARSRSVGRWRPMMLARTDI